MRFHNRERKSLKKTMPTPDRPPITLNLMRRMTGSAPTHERFVGEAIDPDDIDKLALGDLWALAHATETYIDHRPVQTLAAATARMLLDLGREREPVFRGAACRDYLGVLARRNETAD